MEDRPLQMLLNLGSAVLIAMLVGSFVYVIMSALNPAH